MLHFQAAQEMGGVHNQFFLLSSSFFNLTILSPSPAKIAASLTEYWSPQVIAELKDSYVKVAKLEGSIAWHSHEQEDELFYVLKGHLRIEMEQSSIELSEGQIYVIPKGVRHNPVAEQECHIMLIEKKATLHTGDVITKKTRSLNEQLQIS